MDDHDLEEQKLLNFLGDPHTQLRYSCSENNNSDHYFPPNYQYHPHLQQQYNFNHRNNYHRHSGQRRQDQNERSYEPLNWKTRTDDTNSNSAQVSTGTMIPDDVLDDFIAVVEEFNQQDRLKQKPNSQPTRSTPNKSKGFERNLSRSITFNKEEDISINKKKISKSATKSTSKITAKQDGDSQDDKRTHRRSKSDDSSSTVVYSVEVPIKADVLCGQSRVCANHPGNKYFQEVLDRFASTYDRATSKQEKMCMTKEIVSKIHDSGGRFLKKKSGVWEEISTVAARDKVSHALRTKVAAWKRNRKSVNDSDRSKRTVTPPRGARRGSPPQRQVSTSSVSSDIVPLPLTDATSSEITVLESLQKSQREGFIAMLRNSSSSNQSVQFTHRCNFQR